METALKYSDADAKSKNQHRKYLTEQNVVIYPAPAEATPEMKVTNQHF
ncbi:hypothetical protein [Adhaeribacter aerolatus]|nr:hypothetical protein [Adhaeribacter aerolatus]